jgi:hypothetical protein
MLLLAGTDKGLIVYRWVTDQWHIEKIHFMGMPIGYVHQDHRNGSWWVAINHKHWGPKIHVSYDQGGKWEERKVPKFKNEEHTAVKSVWTFGYHHTDPPDKFYIGIEPAALFVTEDGAHSFKALYNLHQHPSRPVWQGGGKGSKDPFLHTILIDPEDISHLTVAISCAGVFQSYDSGESWIPTNSGLKAYFLPDKYPEVGHDPHTLKVSHKNPDIIWQQNHCGIFRSTDRGKTWQDITDSNQKADYGFAMCIDEENMQEAWVIPAQSDFLRIPHDNNLCVYHTNDAGNTWSPKNRGLPQGDAFDLVLRDAMDNQKDWIVFGTNNGNLYFSADRGENWQVITQNLSSVRVVSLISE